MKLEIIKGLSERDADEMRQSFLAGANLRKRLRHLLQVRTDMSVATSRNKDGYSNPNWAYLQADAVGYQRAMQDIISLLTHENTQESEVAPAAELLTVSRSRGRPKGSKNVRKIIL